MTLEEAVQDLAMLDRKREVYRRLIQIKINRDRATNFRTPIEAHRILSIVSNVTGEKISDIRGKSREKWVKNARHIACYIMVHHLKYSRKNAGRAVGRDHSTCIHSLNFMETALWSAENTKDEEAQRVREYLRDAENIIMNT